jgi:penicillin amidase
MMRPGPRTLRLPALAEAVEVAEDALGVPSIRAARQDDAFRAWGYLHARDRFFQMDLLRRAAAGRLAELFGPAALPADRLQRLLGMQAAAGDAVERARPEERALLEAYAQGVNAFLARRRLPGVEYALLRRRRAPWRAEDSALVMLGLFQQLALDVEGKRMERCLRAALPPEVARFFTPRTDAWAQEPEAEAEVPAGALRALMTAHAGRPAVPLVPDAEPALPGSNCWAVAGWKTARGVPLLANDMHLPLGAPNLWHRVEVAYGEVRVAGIAVPGLPVVASGSNGVLAWGMTNLPGDLTELVEVGDAPVRERRERIAVRGGAEERLVVRDSPWGPVLPEPVCGRTVALQWGALWPGAVHFALTRLPAARTLAQALAVAHEGGCPPLNLHLAHREEGIARTVCGRLPRREGERLVPGCFLLPEAVPCVGEPAEGFLVSANDPVPPAPGGPPVGWNHPGAWRRARIAERLAAADGWTEARTLELQRDADAGFYDFYHALAREAAGGAAAGEWPAALRGQVRRALAAWDGRADPGSRGIALLAVYRRRLLGELFSWYLRPCAAEDPAFRYTWRNPEPPLRRLLAERPAGLAPHPERGWEAWLAGVLREAAAALRAGSGRGPDELAWGEFLRVEVRHPLGGTPLTRWLDLPPLAPEGAEESIPAFGVGRGPTQRSAVAPGHEDEGLFQMPGGQSGSPLSPHYRDHHRAWIQGRASPFRPGGARRVWRLVP